VKKGGSKYIKIKIKTETGELVKVTDEKGNPATQLTPAELQNIYQTKHPNILAQYFIPTQVPAESLLS